MAAMAGEEKQDVGGAHEDEIVRLRAQLAERDAPTAAAASLAGAEPAGDTSTPNGTPQRGGRAGEKAQFKEERDVANKKVEALGAELRKVKEERDGALKQVEESFLTRLLNRS